MAFNFSFPLRRIACSRTRHAASIATTLRANHLFGSINLLPSALLCIYRNRNEVTVKCLVDQARRRGMHIALWALDKPIADLSPFTVGRGPGLRMDLLNHLWDTMSPLAVDQLVIVDDDIVFTHGSLSQLQSAASYCEFGIAQPAHHETSLCSYEITRRRNYTLARQTTFVEPGPIFVVSQPWIKHVMPFPKDFGMGWGLWLGWQNLQKHGCKLGILDCLSVKHLSPVASEYSTTIENERLRSLLLDLNLQSPIEAQQTLGTWKVWDRQPSWKS